MANWDKIKNSILKGISDVTETQVNPGDENKIDDDNLRNLAIEKLGLPADWKMSVADRKNYYKNLPTEMGMAGMGTIVKVAAPETAMKNIIAKIQAGKSSELNLAEQLMLKDAKAKAGLAADPAGKVMVQDSVADIAAKKAMENLDKPVDIRSILPDPSASVLNTSSGTAVRELPKSPSMDQILQGNAGRFQNLKNKFK